MKKQTTAAVLCALLLTTFAHDHLKARKAEHLLRGHHAQRSHGHNRQRILNRTNEKCTYSPELESVLDLIVKGGKKTLEEKNIVLDEEKIKCQHSGIEAVINIWEQIGAHVEVATVISDSLNCAKTFFHVADVLSYNNTAIIAKFIKVVAVLLEVISKECPVDKLIKVLIVCHSSPDFDPDTIEKEFTAAIKCLQEAICKMKLEQVLAGLLKVAKSILENCWTENNINVSKVLKTLLKVDPKECKSDTPNSRLTSVVTTLVELKPVCKQEVAFPSLVSQLISLLQSPEGTGCFYGLVPEIATILNDVIEIPKSLLRLLRDVLILAADIVLIIPILGPLLALLIKVLALVPELLIDLLSLLESPEGKPYCDNILGVLKGIGTNGFSPGVLKVINNSTQILNQNGSGNPIQSVTNLVKIPGIQRVHHKERQHLKGKRRQTKNHH